MRIDVYADIACPWCYIGERRLGAALVQFPARDRVRLEFRPYLLDPAAPATAVRLKEYLRRRYGFASDAMMAHASKAAADEGLRFNWDTALMVNTLAAHRLLRLALRDYGPATQRLLVDTLFDAHFGRGLDVGDVDTLATLAESAGIPRARAAEFLAGNERLGEVKHDIAAATQLGVRAVPTFVFDDRYAIQGAQPVSVFLDALHRLAARPVAEG